MERIKEEFLNNIEKEVLLLGKSVLEIGCGTGSRSIQIAKKCAQLIAIDPNSELITLAHKDNFSENIKYRVGKAENLEFNDKQFDIVIFTLSLHHVSADKMGYAIDEAIRVTKKGGNIVFLEPTEVGTFFEAEIVFDACDGDERKEKREAYYAITNHGGYENVAEMSDETTFQFDSVEDFMTNMSPKKNIADVENFLRDNQFILKAFRRINIFKV